METSPKASIDHHPPESIDRHPPDCIDRHPLDDIDQHPRPPICAEEAAWFHKRLKRLHDPVKFVVPCAIFEAE
ncbi:hypothetical protein F2Q70_00042288 [Brassica cretica]|uniref:Uncharacterized protein n=1 Tax=Brassica cretica TaxID=69181 RepID=A0A8S9KDM8_BRACR|nr:hypothetical protein F2Q70_00042288 [Brassica cretica]